LIVKLRSQIDEGNYYFKSLTVIIQNNYFKYTISNLFIVF